MKTQVTIFFYQHFNLKYILTSNKYRKIECYQLQSQHLVLNATIQARQEVDIHEELWNSYEGVQTAGEHSETKKVPWPKSEHKKCSVYDIEWGKNYK